MIYRIRDTTTAWQIYQMEQDFGYLDPIERISVFSYIRGEEGLFIEFPREPAQEFLATWGMYLSEEVEA